MLHGIFIQGTTPTQVFELPFSTQELVSATVTYSQCGSIKVKKKTTQCIFENNYIITSLSQKESLLFIPEKTVKVQLKVLTQGGQVFASPLYLLGVEEVLDKEEIV